MPCSSPKLCLHDTALQFIRASSLLTSAAGVALIILACQVIFPLPSATPNLLIHLWFPLSISILGLLLAVLGLAASCSSTAALFLNGSYLFLIPLEQALVALYIWDYAELKHWASGDETGGFKACLHWIGANAKLAAVLLATLTVLQVSSLVLTVTVVCCCKPKKRNSIKHRPAPWTRSTTDPEAARVPFLPIHHEGYEYVYDSSSDEGYATPRSDNQPAPMATTTTATSGEGKQRKSPRSFPVLLGFIGFTT